MVTDAGAALDSQFVSCVVQIRSNAGLDAVLDSVTVAGTPHLRATGFPSQGGTLVNNATMTAEIFDPAGGRQTVPLLDDGASGDGQAGDGAYGALIPLTGSGLYEADVQASWMSGGETVARAVPESRFIVAPIDLSVDSTGIVPSVSVPDRGSNVSLSLVVHNLGQAFADSAVVTWVQDGVGPIGQSIVTVSPSDSVIAAVSWTAVGDDTVTIHAVASVRPGSSETRYDNNIATAMIPLSPPVVGIPAGSWPAPSIFQLLPPRPNPARGTVEILFDIPRAGRVEAEVFDIAGRRVRWLTRENDLAAGRHSLTWDCRSNSGHALSGGIYLLRVTAGRKVAIQRLVIISR